MHLQDQRPGPAGKAVADDHRGGLRLNSDCWLVAHSFVKTSGYLSVHKAVTLALPGLSSPKFFSKAQPGYAVTAPSLTFQAGSRPSDRFEIHFLYPHCLAQSVCGIGRVTTCLLWLKVMHASPPKYAHDMKKLGHQNNLARRPCVRDARYE